MAAEATNPLQDIPFLIPFDRIRAEHVRPAVDQTLAESRERVQAIANAPGPRTWENTMRALDTLTEPLDTAMAVTRHLESVATYPELREAFNAAEPVASEFYSSIPLDAGLWRAVREYSDTPEGTALQGTQRRYLEKTMHDFKRHGAELDPAGKARLQQIEVELSTLTTRFSQNVLDATNAFDLVIEDEAGLAGLPPTAIAAARQSAESKGLRGWRFTLHEPSYVALMTYLDDRAVRERVFRAHTTRASTGDRNNEPLMARILELRREKAALVGYRHFADFTTEERMAHTGSRAVEFLRELERKTRSAFEREKRELTEFRVSLEGAGAPPLEPWDIGYYAEKQRRALYDYDPEALRPYFPLNRVVEGLFELARRLFGIRVSEQSGAPVWDPHVKYYHMHDENGAFLGAFYADWFPRENKRGGAWMDALMTGVPRPHVGLICGNLTPPVGDEPALLTHREVETIFHEFGHLTHHLVSDVPLRSMAGTNVAWDFVELPSQIMENWCWERASLDLFARHYRTGEPVPEEMFAKMKRARTFRAATAQMRQLSFGLLDLALHIDYAPPGDGGILDYSRRILEDFAPAPLPGDYAMAAGFTHLFGNPVGYGAGYYSYKWAEVLDADAFTRFQSAGIFDAGVGREFRDAILSKGDSRDPAELYEAFMGRGPDQDALLRRLGLV